jgi:hypothetical protein
MLGMDKTATGLGVMILLAVGATFSLQHRSMLAVRSELAELRGEVHQLRLAGTAPGRPVSGGPRTVQAVGLDDVDLSSVMRAEAGATQGNVAPSPPAAVDGAGDMRTGSGMSVVPIGVIPAGELRNFGRATPEAGVATAIWAAIGGEVETLTDALMFSPELKEKADAWFAGLPEQIQKDHRSPERAIASVLAREAGALGSLQVLGRNETSPDEVVVRARFETLEGKTKEENFLMRRMAGGWGMELPDDFVKKLARGLVEEK